MKTEFIIILFYFNSILILYMLFAYFFNTIARLYNENEKLSKVTRRKRSTTYGNESDISDLAQAANNKFV